MPSEIRITDNSAEILAHFEEACMKALEECGLVAEGWAKTNITQQRAVDTGNLRNSITHSVDSRERAAYVGTPVDYAPYVELGTGKYVPGGSPPWVYMDDEGNWHKTSGQPPRPFIKPSVADHESEYREIIKEELQGK